MMHIRSVIYEKKESEYHWKATEWWLNGTEWSLKSTCHSVEWMVTERWLNGASVQKVLPESVVLPLSASHGRPKYREVICIVNAFLQPSSNSKCGVEFFYVVDYVPWNNFFPDYSLFYSSLSDDIAWICNWTIW